MRKLLYEVLFFLALSIVALSCGQQHGKSSKETGKNAADGAAWLQGEWKNAVYGDIVDIYPDDSIRFLKNGLVFSEGEEEDWMWDYPKPEIIADLEEDILFQKKFPYEIGIWHEPNLKKDIKALLFKHSEKEYPYDLVSTYLGIDYKEKQLYYYSNSGEKVYLTKTSDLVYDVQLQKREEQKQMEVVEKNESLSKEIAAHEFDWLRGYWDLDYITRFVVNIDDDSVKVEVGETDETTGRFVANPSQTQKNAFKLQYNINDFTDEVDLVLVPSGLYVDKEGQSLYTYYDFDQRMDFEHVSTQTQDEQPSVTKVNRVVPGICGIKGRASYTWADENLNGRVKSYNEKGEKNGSGYSVTKKFDEKGNIVYYYSDANWTLGYGIYPKGDELPINDIGFLLNHNLFNPAQIKLAQVSKGASINSISKRYLDNVERTYKYDISGNITALYENNRLLYEFEYDAYGRVTKMLENGKPSMIITWAYNWDPSHVAYTIKFYSPEGYDAGEYKFAWRSKDVLATVNNNGKEDFYHYPEFTFYDFPQVKTATYLQPRYSTVCYFYDEKGHMTHLVNSKDKIELYNFNNNPRGAVEEYYVGYCKSYKYNDNGDVCSASSSAIYWPWNHRNYNEFIDYIFRYNFNQLPAPEKETTWRYVYDDHGNWTKRERYEVIHGDIDIENLQDVTIRKYVYYE